MATPIQTVFHFFRLLGEVNVHWDIPGEADHRCELLRRAGSQTMRGDAHHRIIQPGNRLPASLEQDCVAVDVGHEVRLPRLGCRASEAGMGVEYGQERQTDPDFLRSGRDAARHLGGVRESLTALVVVNVVKLADA